MGLPPLARSPIVLGRSMFFPGSRAWARVTAANPFGQDTLAVEANQTARLRPD